MKKLFTIDDIMVSFISALGYGFGETISRLSGWSKPMCMVASLVVGLVVGEIINKIAFSKTVQKKPINRIITYVACFLLFLIAQGVSVWWMGVSMIDYVTDEVAFVVIFPVVGFGISLLIRGYRVYKIRKVYGDGSEGFVFNLKEEEIEDLNRENQPIDGKYDTDLAVKTRTGIYVGEEQKKVKVFLGIPYAKPPVGELRWKAPEPLPSSEAVFEAKHFGASPIQVEHKGSFFRYHRQSEDCLTLNIYVAEEETRAKKPVIVMFHYGDFSYGGSADPLLDGSNYVSKHPDVVYVSFNFRLGILGFIDFSEVPGGEACPDALNLGLLDQIAALQWIQENIAAFGGNPNRITVAGFEAGAISICMLAACERAKGLFQKAFVFTGILGAAYETPEGSRTLAGSLLKETQSSTMEELMKLDTEAIEKATQQLWKSMYGPTCDGELIPKNVYQAYQESAASGIEFVIGIPSDETQVLRSFLGKKNYEEFILFSVDDILSYTDDDIVQAAREYIRTQTALSSEFEAKEKIVEQWINLSIYRSAVTLNRGGNKVHLLYWEEEPLIENLGSGTVDVLASFLGNGEASQMYGNVIHADLSVTLQDLLLKFVKGEALRLYQNEIKGVDAFNWKKFPNALIVRDEKLQCDRIEDKLTDVKALMDFTLE